MKIVHVTDCYLPRTGGIERQVHDLACRQIARGDEVTVVTTTVGRPGGPGGPAVVRAPARWRRPGTMRYPWSQSGRDLVLRSGADVVHLHTSAWSPLGYVSGFSLGRAGIPTAVTVHSLWDYASPLFTAFDGFTRWSRWPLAWSAVSEVAASQVRRYVDAPVRVVPNGVELAAWRVEALPRRPDRLVVATVGRLAPRKRPLHLLRMLRQVRARLPESMELEAVIVGDGPLADRVAGAVRRHRMDWVRLVGQADAAEIRRLYRDVDLYLAAATLESFGIAALEARAAGIPVVAYRASGVGDFVHHGVEGVLARDDAGFVDAVVGLARDPQRLRRMQAHNTAVPPAIGWPEVLAGCDALYLEAAERAGRSATWDRSPALR